MQAAPFAKTAVKNGDTELLGLQVAHDGLLFPIRFTFEDKTACSITPAAKHGFRSPGGDLERAVRRDIDQIASEHTDAVPLFGAQNGDAVYIVSGCQGRQSRLIQGQRVASAQQGFAFSRHKHGGQGVGKILPVPGRTPDIVFPQLELAGLIVDRQYHHRPRLGFNVRHGIAGEDAFDDARIETDRQFRKITCCAALLVLDLDTGNHFRHHRQVQGILLNHFAEFIHARCKVERRLETILLQGQSFDEPVHRQFLALAHRFGLRGQRIVCAGIDGDIRHRVRVIGLGNGKSCDGQANGRNNRTHDALP